MFISMAANLKNLLLRSYKNGRSSRSFIGAQPYTVKIRTKWMNHAHQCFFARTSIRLKFSTNNFLPVLQLWGKIWKYRIKNIYCHFRRMTAEFLQCKEYFLLDCVLLLYFSENSLISHIHLLVSCLLLVNMVIFKTLENNDRRVNETLVIISGYKIFKINYKSRIIYCFILHVACIYTQTRDIQWLSPRLV